MKKLILWQDNILKKNKFLIIILSLLIFPSLLYASEKWILDKTISTIDFELPVLFAKNVQGKFNSINGFVELDLNTKKNNMKSMAQKGYTTATDFADYLVKKKNLPFREAYVTSSKLVNYAEKKKVRLDQLSIGEINKFIKKFKIDNKVKLLGYQNNPWKFLSKSNLFVLPSIWEGFGNVIVESMLIGIPVLSSDCPS